jgi:dienelactone hydrolase
MLGCVGFLAGSALGAYAIVSEDVTRPHPSLERVKYEVAAGTGPLDRFSITHVRKRGGNGSNREPVVLLSPFTLPGEFYEITETGCYLNSAAGGLAQRGYDVWLVDQRRAELPPGACESGAADCSVMATWNFDTLSSDALFAVSLARAKSPGKKPVLGGFSAGANTAMATVNREPAEFSGLFLYEGTFYTEDPTIRAHNDSICTNLEAALAGGAAYDPAAAILGLVLRSADADRTAPFPLPVFSPGTSNQLALLLVFGAQPPPGAVAPTPTFIRNIADFETQSFVYTNQDRLELVGPLFDNYGSLASLRDLACGLAGRDSSNYDRLSGYRGDVLIFVEGTGFGPAMFDTAGLFDQASSVTIDHNPEFGEADPYFHVDWKQTFLNPLIQWLQHRPGSRAAKAPTKFPARFPFKVPSKRSAWRH